MRSAMTTFLNMPHAIRFRPSVTRVVIEMMFLVQLVQDVLRAFDGARHQLRVIQHIESQIAKVPLRFLMTAIHFDGVTERLKGMKGKPDRQNDRKTLDGIVPADEVGERRQVLIGKVEILEECQHTDVGQDAGDQHPALRSSFKFFQTQPGKVIHSNGHDQDDDVFGDECHVKIATGSQQEQPAEAVWQ